MSLSLTVEYDVSRISEIPDTVTLVTEDDKITANRTLLRIVSRVIHDKLLEDPDLSVFDLKNLKKAAIDNLLHLIYNGKAKLNDEVEMQEVINLARDLDVNITQAAMTEKNIKVDAPEVPEDEPKNAKNDDPVPIELPDGRFGCGICFKSFGRKATAKEHYQNIHVAKEKNISCRLPECDKKFSNMHYMKIHMSNVHGIPAAMITATNKAKSAKSVKKSNKKEAPKKVVKEELQTEKMDAKEEPIED